VEHQSIIAAIDAELSRLQQARQLLAKNSGIGSAIVQRTVQGTKPAKKRVLSPEARKRIAEAQKKQWASHKTAELSAIKARPKKAAKKAVKKTAKKQPTGGKAPAKTEASTAVPF
jgi:hypothetical protein